MTMTDLFDPETLAPLESLSTAELVEAFEAASRFQEQIFAVVLHRPDLPQDFRDKYDPDPEGLA